MVPRMKRLAAALGRERSFIFRAFIFSLAAMFTIVRADSAVPLRIDTWHATEITLTSSFAYKHPFNDVDVSATFSNKELSITRPAFWDGGNTWRIRFAPTRAGTWTYTTTASDTANSGLNGQSGTVIVSDNRRGPAIFTHGFIRVSDNHRYFVYDDGTPFFYLGDTHWFAMRERFTISNLPDCSSQFKREVDTRLAEGFTVYQSEWMPASVQNPAAPQEAFYDWKNGITEDSLPGFRNIDRKFQYLADHGMVIANALAWRDSIVGYDDGYIRKLARYWSARYGAYPVLWTMAQEVDTSYPGDSPSLDDKWQTMAQALSASDDYHHPLSAHMCNTNVTVASTSSWRTKPYHTWYAAQVQGGPMSAACASDFWNSTPTKPAIVYEAGYENFWADEAGERCQAYTAFLSGFYGYGYGVAGIWDDGYSCDPPDRGTPYDKNRHVWYDALVRPSGMQMGYMRKFFEQIRWWELAPHYDIANWATVAEPGHACLAASSDATVMLLYNKSVQSGVLHRLSPNSTYDAWWFDPRSGTSNHLAMSKSDSSGDWQIPAKPDALDWVLLLKRTGR